MTAARDLSMVRTGRLSAPPAVAVTTTPTIMHTVPAGKVQIVQVLGTNVDGVNDAALTVEWMDDSAADVARSIIKGTVIKAGDAVQTPPKVLEAGDAIRVTASANGDIEAHVDVIAELDA